ncbi:hypothetical protein MKK63_20405 [Methylobacterium sp. J-088]|uniref:hypothetical protein n=1 Tax=Methylobacterium sp. J-088 TaxID=2836664 RepID=UPI001FBA958C|nr:hypothetical protein [Methylobacterium sp. J-088]MCJ2065054.1 hypothetical protein [Methylobacterium sp. J-088]
MAVHARITPALLSATSHRDPLLRQGSGRQPGPVTQAIRAMRAAEPLPPTDVAIEAIREGLIRYFVEADSADRQRVRDLRRRISDRIEADLALLDALSPDPEAELTALERVGRGFEWSGYDDAEDGHDAEGLTDDSGIVDHDAAVEQGFAGYGGCLCSSTNA